MSIWMARAPVRNFNKVLCVSICQCFVFERRGGVESIVKFDSSCSSTLQPELLLMSKKSEVVGKLIRPLCKKGMLPHFLGHLIWRHGNRVGGGLWPLVTRDKGQPLVLFLLLCGYRDGIFRSFWDCSILCSTTGRTQGPGLFGFWSKQLQHSKLHRSGSTPWVFRWDG